MRKDDKIEFDIFDNGNRKFYKELDVIKILRSIRQTKVF
jgi:hypothetical protein